MATTQPYERCFDEDVAHTTNTCPECEGRVTTNTHETVCDDCGLVLSDQRVDPGPERRWFRDDGSENPARTGAPWTPTRHDRGLSTEIGWKQNGSREVSGTRRRQLGRLRRLHRRSQFNSKKDWYRMDGLYEVRRLTGALELGAGLRDQACALFASLHGAGLATGRSLAAVAAVAVYVTCRVNGLPWTQTDVLEETDCDRSLFRATLQAARQEVGLELPPRSPAAFVPRLVSAVEAPDGVRARATEIAESLPTEVYNGANPSGVAAACVYVAAKDQGATVTQKQLAAAADVTPVTIRSRLNAISAVLEER
jgi:transcription initiation factor TFIIB